ncbi:aspartyl protease family protein [Gracilimonas sediminicola]|uniref:Aspartyl protease family protein n=1 Tax=Gracilimonas sediminicola TaxID=2952158 RepID=A0A9X2L130_9BACT|nr:aspartyl protease family protein [Gracilimonas sediminicola]MCP9290386.1 aspartyl protease family protein [Gracilimonas sediminicola]
MALFKGGRYRVIVASIWVVLFIQLAETKQVFAQDSTSFEPRKAAFTINGRADRPVVIPFELVNNLIIIEASINGSVPLKLIVDTGVGNILITALPKGEEIYLRSSRTVTLSGLGEGEPVEAFYAEKNRLDIGRVTGENVEVLFMKEDIFQLASFMGTFVHGLIGYDLFSEFAVEINYLSKELILYDPEKFEEKFQELPEHRKWHKLPIYIEDRKPYIDVAFKQRPGISYTPLRLLIDSGSSNAFSLYKITHEEIVVPKSNISTLIGVGLSGNVNGYLGRIQKMKLGDEFIFEEPVIAYPDSFAVRRALGLGDRNGSLGGEVLRRFKVIFHYRDEYILLRANRDLGDNFYYNISGIEVNTPVPNIPLYVVSEVREGSPAEKQGIQKGDVIKFINGEPAARLNLNDILNILQKNQGSRIRVGVQRDTLYKSYKIRLENELKVDPKE